jgi:hypothetical protein
MNNILVKYASRQRPGKFARGMDSILKAKNISRITVLVSLDTDDPDLVNYHLAINRYNSLRVICIIGLSTGKISAINRDLEAVQDWDILVNFSDDMVFTADGWDEVIESHLTNDNPQFLHLPDGHQNEKISTMSIMNKLYFLQDGYIYHPSYTSSWCDVEATEVAKLRNQHKYVNARIFDHLHVAWGRAEWDQLYVKNENRELWSHDETVYQNRKAKNYELQVKQLG